MAEYIEREAALRVLCDACGNAACSKGLIPRCSYYEKMQSIPAADAIEELQADKAALNGTVSNLIQQIEELSKPRWIPTTEQLPEDLTRVIVFCEDGVSYGLCEHLIADDEEVVEWHDFLHYPITPTHWMPLPEPPKEET